MKRARSGTETKNPPTSTAAGWSRCKANIGVGSTPCRQGLRQTSTDDSRIAPKKLWVFLAFAAVVLDPPHTGAPVQIAQLAASSVARVIYVSCDPAALARDAAVLFEHVEVARLTMRPFSERFRDLYLDAVGSAATASVGAYQIEGLGIELFERIDGDYFTILGLPLIPALDFLRRRGCLLA